MDDELFTKLDDELTNTFEDNILMKFAVYALPIDQAADPSQYRTIMQRYNRARAAYLNAVADLILNPDALDDYV